MTTGLRKGDSAYWLAAALVVTVGSLRVQAGDKIKITKLDDLPRRSYKVTMPLTDLLQNEEQFAELARNVEADITADLAKYDIEDKTLLKRFYKTLANVNSLNGRLDAVIANLDRVRELEEKPASKLAAGVMQRASIKARRQVGASASPSVYAETFGKALAAALKSLPWDVVQDLIKGQKGQLEILSEGFVLGIVQAHLQPSVSESGELGQQLAERLISFRVILTKFLPIKAEAIAALQSTIDANAVEKKDIWPKRSCALAKDQGLTPVVAAVWDTGVDVDVFKGLMDINEKETINGKDSDGNGFVDDVYGIAHDLDLNPSTAMLYPLGDASDRVKDLYGLMKGFHDLQAAIDSPESSELKKKLASVAPEDVKGFIEDAGRCAIYLHGTHVAGIMAEGNPFIRLVVARLTADYRTVPKPDTVEDAYKAGEIFKKEIGYFKARGVRLVNMSWVIQRTSVERGLEANGIGETPEKRAELARKIFDIYKAGLYAAMSQAPEILFVGGAGNFDNDVTFDEIIPPQFELSNILIAGAVDQAGEPAGFTSFGDSVDVYGNGFQVDSFVPGGERMKLSGTSMSSPHVANLAAKLFALRPQLTPKEVGELIKDAAEPSTGNSKIKVIHPKRTMQLLHKRYGTAVSSAR